MRQYEVYCKGPFPDGRGGECQVRIGTLELPMMTDPRPHLSSYMCCACGAAEVILRPLSFQNEIPWWDPDYRASVIRALDVPCRVFPFEHVDPNIPGAVSDHERRLANAVAVALGPLVRQSIPEREMVRRIIHSRARPAKVVREKNSVLVVGA